MLSILYTLKSYFYPSKEEDWFFKYATCSASVNELAHSRELEVCELARKIAKQIGITNHRLIHTIRLESNPLTMSFAIANYGNELNLEIYYNYFFLLKPEDFPQELRLTDYDDPHLVTDEYLKKVIDWFKGFLGIKELYVGAVEKEVILGFLKLLSDPKKFNAVKKFVFTHELIHLHKKHQITHEERFNKGSTVRKIMSALFGLFIFSKLKSKDCSYFFSISTGIDVYNITRVVLDFLVANKISRENEKEADLLAKKHGAGKGGVYLFKGAQQQILSAFRRHNLSIYHRLKFHVMFTSEGSRRFPFLLTHPSEAQRIHYLKQS